MKIGLALREVVEAESELVGALLEVGERHRTDHDVFHVTRTLAKLEGQNRHRLAPFGERYDSPIELDGGTPDIARPLKAVREKGAELLGRRPEPALLLLHDLREIYLLASEASIDWVMLAQASQAARDVELLDAVSESHSGTLRTLKWATYRIKAAAPQVLA
jgi:hypothetical protein